MEKNSKTYRVALYGIMFGMIIVGMAIDKLVSLSLPSGISTAVCVLLVTFSFCLITNDWATAFFAGAFFGLASLVKAFIFGEVAFVSVAVGNGSPLILLYSVCIYLLPRLFVGVACFAVYRLTSFLLRKMSRVRLKETISLSVGIFVGLVTNTVLFLTALNAAKTIFNVQHSTLLDIIKIVIYTNILPEYLVSIIVAPIIIIGVRRALHLGIEAKNISKELNTNDSRD